MAGGKGAGGKGCRAQGHRQQSVWTGGTLIIGMAIAGILSTPAIAWALATSVAREGIDARRLHQPPYDLTGHKIAIGQVEIGRPSQFGLDKVARRALPVNVQRLFFLEAPATPNTHVDFHAAAVASVMISQDKAQTGVAPQALLYGSAVGPVRGRSGQPDECLAAQQVALSNGTDVRAINFSFGEPLSRDPRPNPVLDGNALLTQCIDWSAQVHNVLYVIAGNQGRGGIPIPTDNFNGMNVAYSRRVNGRFVQVDPSNLGSEPESRGRSTRPPESNVGARRSITLVAPGSEITTFGPSGSTRAVSGSSFAAPHVTATVALLQELGDRQLRAGRTDWSLDARQSMVTKAVLLNAADKLEDAGDGLRLGMSRTLYDKNNRLWTDGDAYSNPAIPLHADMGTGHLNAYRAVMQLDGGQWQSTAPVPVRGWNYDTLAAPLPREQSPQGSLDRDSPAVQAAVHDYAFDQPLQGGSYLAATLTWQRQVELVDLNRNTVYDIGETFRDRGLNNLDLYLMAIDDEGTATPVWASHSVVDTTEHIFFPIPATGRYQLRVVYQQQFTPTPEQPYALAWWGMAAPTP